MAVAGNFRTRGDAESSQLRLARLMRSQSGVAGLRQLRAVGFTKAEVAGMVRRRELWQVRRGVYADTRSPMTPRGHLFAAALSFAPECHRFFSHRTAAARFGLRELSLRRPELPVVAAHTPKRPPLRIHRVSERPPVDEIRLRGWAACELPTAPPRRARSA